MQLPTDPEIRALHARHAPTPAAFDLVYTHCAIVCRIAEQFLDRRGTGLDRGLVRAGSLLHDIGVYRLFGASGELDHARYIRHGILGHEILAEEGLPDALRRFCSHHTGISSDDVRAQCLPVPIGDYLPETGEELLVSHADAFHSKTDPPVFRTAASYTHSIRRFGAHKTTRFAAMLAAFGEPDFGPLTAAYGHALADRPSRRSFRDG
ncbi:uncharacterized protein CLV63_104221 [Murinocardiopsis flavida]|uniref:HD domain-containing protein n=1 Tax=Murinocardiopsis flavida TaxID=645275 RepID=A0A2P8DP47_9ACTN|nr:HDIG domain-containing metalloprotein [Murinocardiopsis flavida]PSK98997.1 uncharacterized protein CLV63_104221 [Murinocardiopsis flavida]